MTQIQPVRNSCRVVLIDGTDRVLLLQFAINDDTSVWIPPGGGPEAGEALEASAIRELWEETGLRLNRLGPLIWVRHSVWPIKDIPAAAALGIRVGDLATFAEYYYIGRVSGYEVGKHLNIDEFERSSVRGLRWWSLAEIEGSSELFGPARLAELLKPILQGDLPEEPIQVEAS